MDSIVEYSIHNHMIRLHATSIFFFFNDTATTEIYTLSLHDALPISGVRGLVMVCFTLPSFGVVFKVIRDRFPHPKTVLREEVLAKYQLVFIHDRAGRLVDAQEFRRLRFPRERFAPELLDELNREAPNTVHEEG